MESEEIAENSTAEIAEDSTIVDSLKVNYNDETGLITLEWDPEDSRWNWLATLTEEEINSMIMEHARQSLEESEYETQTNQ